jgi:predicted RNA-binding protein associated with RNAse of E/G family
LKSLKGIGEDGYMADGVVEADDTEICLLEISGEYSSTQEARHSYDHVKGLFGLIAMFQAVVKRYHYATLKSVMGLRLTYVHVRGKHYSVVRIADKIVYKFLDVGNKLHL